MFLTLNISAQLTLNNFYYVTDGGDDLHLLNYSAGTSTTIGDMGAGNDDVEAIAYWPHPTNPVLYACDHGIFGTINISTGEFISIGQVDGGGLASGAAGNLPLNDVDGLAFDPRTGILWATERRGLYNDGNPDLIFQIDPATGLFIEDAFGAGVDYVILSGSFIYEDIDDIAISPVTGEMYAVSNEGGTTDQLLKINKNTGVIQVVNDFPNGLRKVEGFSCNNAGDYYITTGSRTSGYPRANRIFQINVNNATIIDSSSLKPSDTEALAALLLDANEISGTVWDDDDVDQIIDGSESGLSGISVELYVDSDQSGTVNAGDVLIQTTETDANGEFEFYFATTEYLVMQVDGTTVPSGYMFSTDNIEVAVFTDNVNFGETDQNNDFGLYNSSTSCAGGGPAVQIGSSSIDSDGDGVNDACDLDSDNDGILDTDETIADTDNDGIDDYLDLDSDNDGIPDSFEANYGQAPTGYSSSAACITGSDSDGDGLLDDVDDASSTMYGSSASTLPYPDTDGDGVKDNRDKDSDNDGIMDCTEAGGTDSNGDGIIDSFTDTNSDGYHDNLSSSPLNVPNTDNSQETTDVWNLRPNHLDIDSDADGIDDTREGLATCGVDVPCYSTPTILNDSDGDGVIDFWDSDYSGEAIDPYDKDGDAIPDYIDTDTDEDGIDDITEGNDADNNDVADTSPSGNDTDGDGLDDNFDDESGSYGGYTNYPLQDEDSDDEHDWRDNESDSNPLNVELIKFIANHNNDVITLNWETVSENNNKGFFIEKSYDAINFEEIGFVNGNNNSRSLNSYSFTDYYPVDGTQYYRLKQIDNNGSFEYSIIISVEIERNLIIINKIYPNPFNNEIICEIKSKSNQKIQISIYNSIGSLLISKSHTTSIGVSRITINDIQNYNSGLYYLIIENENGNKERIKIIKN